MTVSLEDLIEPLKFEVQAPGTDVYPNATDDDYLGYLTNSFWELRLYGFLGGYEEDAASRGGPPEFTVAIVTPINVDATYDDIINGGVLTPTGGEYSPAMDLSRDLQQLIIVWAGWKMMLSRMSSLNTSFRSKAGPVEYETQQAATVLKSILDQLKQRIDYILAHLPSSYGGLNNVTVLDAIVERTYSVATNETWWVR
jgi:hypothetical protein